MWSLWWHRIHKIILIVMTTLNAVKKKLVGVWEKLPNWIMILAAIVAVISFIVSIIKPDETAKIRGLIEDYRSSQFPSRYHAKNDSTLMSEPEYILLDKVQDEIESYYNYCGSIKFSYNGSLSNEERLVVCRQTLKQLYESNKVFDRIRESLKELISTDSISEIYIKYDDLKRIADQSEILNKRLNTLVFEINDTNDKEKITKLIWNFVLSDELYSMLESRKTSLMEIYKSINLIIDRMISNYS